ncbi:MAG TPA: hypothetical protein VIU13_01265 [Chryseolinea sp.]
MNPRKGFRIHGVVGILDNYRAEPVSALADMNPTSYQLSKERYRQINTC